MARRRLDKELVRRGLTATRSAAQDAIARGVVTIDGAPASKAATLVSPQENLVLEGPPRPFVSRGGQKLAAALDDFGVNPAGRRCLDAGASTGGFTDCLLQRGAAHVTAVDVGYGQIDYGLRTDDRVTILERTNVRELAAADLAGPPPDLVVADLSFISLRLVLAPLHDASAVEAEAVLLVKPQFEAGREHVGKGGIVRSPRVWQTVLQRVGRASSQIGWWPSQAVPSALTGSSGNVEFFLHVVPRGSGPAASPPMSDESMPSDAMTAIRTAVDAAVAREQIVDDRLDDPTDVRDDGGVDREASQT